jgi:hypothetical protein
VLRVFHHKYTTKFASHECIIHLDTKKLLKLQEQIEMEAAAVASTNYKKYLDLGFTSTIPWRASAPFAIEILGGRGLSM